MKLNVEYITGIGQRKENQDLITIEELSSGASLFMVTDGMGGYERGLEAAKIVSENIVTFLNFSDSINEMAIQHAINKANLGLKVFHREKGLQSGATVAGIVIQGNKAHVFWVGDVKVFHVRNQETIFETESHSLINELRKENDYHSPEMIEKYRHVVTRSVSGVPSKSIIGYSLNEISFNDKFIICSDGVHDIISKDRIIKLSTAKVDEVLKEEGKDNYSWVKIQIM